MIIGIGTDILQIERLRRSLRRFGAGYLEEMFTPQEIAMPQVTLDAATHFSLGFCAKEACAKALGTGIDADVDWFDIEIDYRTPSPRLMLSGGARTRLEFLTSAGSVAVPQLSLGVAGGLAQAIVIIATAD
ncbi:holo-ACP synthase [Sphingomonas morindae]|uniref:Holo-[acyl-carrier-protein] synthase n=1 Tax=Sphingomonas morindae TaxID=1541170 RepID=A0ABY4XA66_9SPHN|nr:holo-ACP synthase [Sphingomonas morindae]USI73571.1 holo-ACP synthase [Sphingomonas morindae]